MKTGLLLCCVMLLAWAVAAWAQEPPLRLSDSLWLSEDAATGEPKLTSLTLSLNQPRTVFLWLRVQPEPDYDVAGFYFPLYYGRPKEDVIRVGADGWGSWPGATGAPAGMAPDPSFVGLGPFAAWNVRSLHDRSFSSLNDSSEVLAGFLLSVPPGAGWSGRAPIASLTLTGVGPGLLTLQPAKYLFASGARSGVCLTNAAGTRSWRPVVVPLGPTPVGVESGPTRLTWSLEPGRPNPFSGRTTIRYSMPNRGRVQLLVLDAAGRVVTTLVDGERAAGSYSVDWDARRLPSGVYLCRLEAGGRSQVRKALHIR